MTKPSRDRGRHLAELALAVYRQMHREGSSTLEGAAAELGLDPTEAATARQELERLGLVTAREDGTHVSISPESAIVNVLARGQHRLAEYRDSILDMQETLDRVVGEYLPLGSGPKGQLDFHVMTDLRKVAAYLDSMTSLAREEMLSMHPGPLPAPQLMAEGRDRDRQLAERGLKLRTIYARSLTSARYVTDYINDLAAFGYQIRVAAVLPIRMLICDRRRVVMPLDPQDGRAGAVAIDGDLFVRSLVAIFEYCWQHSSRLEDIHTGRDDQSLTEQERMVLRMLAAGLKDERIARDLGVSVRTVSRMVGELMQRLGAESRFQAGVYAAQLGWID
ncbi:MAG: hypothetical protein AUI14_18250 [Actinobacteria bacterium 13_2_20CM_2_71_6]|nr:MAG: hypothetical protein AUI14_18250 [Actinobacteria bacterium 13_2_20CM_2_71_6]